MTPKEEFISLKNKLNKDRQEGHVNLINSNRNLYYCASKIVI